MVKILNSTKYDTKIMITIFHIINVTKFLNTIFIFENSTIAKYIC